MKELKVITEGSELNQLIKESKIKNLDLSEFDFCKHKVDFSSKELENVDFTGNEKVCSISFKNAKLIGCKFKRTKVNLCDFRYVEIIDSTFEGTELNFCDFYRAAFKGIIIFRNCKIANSSLYYISFDTYCITKENLSSELVQENKNKFKEFQTRWRRFDRIDNNELQEAEIERNIASCYLEAEQIYRQFSALWESKGYNRDGEWAYVKAKRMERKHLLYEKRDPRSWLKAFGNGILDIIFGYGVSLWRVFVTYCVLILFFGLIYSYWLEKDLLWDTLEFSFFKTIGATHDLDDVIEGIIAVLHTGIGMLLTGFMGFVLANKIRKS